MLRWIAGLIFLTALTGRGVAQEIPTADDAAGIPPVLLEALTKVAQSFYRWAYTETRRVTDNKGVTRYETVVRFDPSKPYAEQYQPLKIDGKPPTERQLKDYRRRGEKRAERFAKEEAEGKMPGTQLPRFGMNGSSASIDLQHARVVEENAQSVTYEVPLRNDLTATIPVEKFQLMARVGKQSRAFENVALRVRSGFRVKLVVKVTSGEATMDFGVADPKFPPVPLRLAGDASATVMFVKLGANFDLARTELKRVKPYSERFGVKIGPLKALDF
ncbi:MAG: hypothetical protein JWM35_1717 [Verrucomicrobia bacterium]|nr:hypothetical protein [Verrucomicrobiota bacterium]